MRNRPQAGPRTQHLRAAGTSRLILALAGLALAGAVACGHRVDNGHYVFTADSIDPAPDECDFSEFDGGQLWDGNLLVSGEEVNLAYGLGCTDQHPLSSGCDGVRMVGLFKAPEYGKSDGFLADGTGSQVSAPLVFGPCPADFLQIHMDTSIQDSDHFSGTMSIRYTFTPVPQPNPCHNYGSGCSFSAHFHAVRQ